MFDFHEIPTTNDEYANVQGRLSSELIDFKDYGEYQTKIAGKAKKNSQKGSSYKRCLTRLIIGYEEIFNDKIDTIKDFETYNKLMEMKRLEGFSEFNKATNHFYSATLGCLLAYITFIKSETEMEVDLELNSEFNSKDFNNQLIEYEEVKDKLVKRKDKRVVKEREIYPRNYNEALKAKETSKWSCENNPNHETFINEIDRNPHVEAHHLIPMAAQDYFDVSIDFADNIISLCPTCHRKIHYAISTEKKKMIKNLYKKRKNRYKKLGLNIELNELYKMYGILK